MEQLTQWGDILVLLTTGQCRSECQMWEWWDRADVVINLSRNHPKAMTLTVLKGSLEVECGS